MVSHPLSRIREGRKQRNHSFSLLGVQIDPSESEEQTSLISTTLFMFSKSVHRQAQLPRTWEQARQDEEGKEKTAVSEQS
jgi:hypothetical protein